MRRRQIFKPWLATAMLILCFLIHYESQAQMLRGRMYKNDKVVVILDSKITTRDLKAGEKVAAHVKSHLKRGNDTYVYGEELVWAKVNSLKKPGIYGGKAELVIGFDSTKSTGGTTIPLIGEIKLQGKGKGILPYLLFPIGWLFKGSHIETTGTDTCVTSVNVPEYITVQIKP